MIGSTIARGGRKGCRGGKAASGASKNTEETKVSAKLTNGMKKDNARASARPSCKDNSEHAPCKFLNETKAKQFVEKHDPNYATLFGEEKQRKQRFDYVDYVPSATNRKADRKDAIATRLTVMQQRVSKTIADENRRQLENIRKEQKMNKTAQLEKTNGRRGGQRMPRLHGTQYSQKTQSMPEFNEYAE